MHLSVSIEIAVSADKVWAILGEQFGHIGVWAAPIEFSSLEGCPRVGAVRNCHIQAFGPVPAGVVQERLLDFEPAAMHFTYHALSGLPRFMAQARNRWSVRALGGERCLVQSESSFELRGMMYLAAFMLKPRLLRSGQEVLQDLKYFAEHGQPHPRKITMRGQDLPPLKSP